MEIEIPNRLAADHDRLAVLEGSPEAQRPVVHLQPLAPERAEDQVKRQQEVPNRRVPEQDAGDQRDDERDDQNQDDYPNADHERHEGVQVLLAVGIGHSRTAPVGLLSVDSEVEPAVLEVHVHFFFSFVRKLAEGRKGFDSH